jgi:hypothetical protein
MTTPTDDMTTLTLELRKETTERLKVRAAESGQDVARFVSDLVENFSAPPTSIDVLSGDINRRFIESGMTEEELVEELDRAKHEMRADRRARNAS